MWGTVEKRPSCTDCRADANAKARLERAHEAVLLEEEVAVVQR